MRFCAVAAIAAALSGCAAEARLTAPGIAVPSRFNGTGGAATDLQRWWTRFGSRQLDSLVEQASQGNFDLAAASARLEQADAQARIAGAALLPAVTLSAGPSGGQSSGTTAGRPFFRPTPRTSISGVLAASYEVDIWGRNRDLLRAAQSTSEASGYVYEVVRLTTYATVVNAYMQLAASRDRLAIAQSNLSNADRILSVLRERLAAGTGTALDLAQQESLVASQRAVLPILRQNAEIARTSLALLLGRPPQGFSLSVPSLRSLRAPRIAPGLPSDLLLRRPDLRAAEAQLAAADADLDAARKALLPSIQLTGQGGFQSAALSTLLRPESALWSLAAGLTQPIFDGGRLLGQADFAEGRRRELLETYRQSIVAALVDVENALTAIRESAAREAAQTEAVAKSREAFGFAEQRLREGTIDLQTLLNTQGTLFSAQDSLIQDRLARLQAVLSLIQALGGDFATVNPARSQPRPRSANPAEQGRAAAPVSRTP